MGRVLFLAWDLYTISPRNRTTGMSAANRSFESVVSVTARIPVSGPIMTSVWISGPTRTSTGRRWRPVPVSRGRFSLLAILILWGFVMLGAAGPDRRTVEPWLGEFAAGPERIALRWTEAGLLLELGNVAVPVDGIWHETVPTFFVRQRATWVASPQVLFVEEQHNLGAVWRYELRLAPDGRRLLKVVPASTTGTTEFVQRTFERVQ